MCLLIGPTGAGKTLLLKSLQTGNRILLFFNYVDEGRYSDSLTSLFLTRPECEVRLQRCFRMPRTSREVEQ